MLINIKVLLKRYRNSFIRTGYLLQKGVFGLQAAKIWLTFSVLTLLSKSVSVLPKCLFYINRNLKENYSGHEWYCGEIFIQNWFGFSKSYASASVYCLSYFFTEISSITAKINKRLFWGKQETWLVIELTTRMVLYNQMLSTSDFILHN